MAPQKTARPSKRAPSSSRLTLRTEEVFRRRRRGAAVTGGLVLIALAIAAIGAHGGHGPRTARGHAAHKPVVHAKAAQPQAVLQAQDRAIEAVRAYTPVIVGGGDTAREVALTFDDGPGPYTKQLVAELDRLHVRATFFTVGSQEQYFSSATAAEIASGDAVEDHSEAHPMMSRLSPHDQYEQLFEPIARIELLGGRRPHLFRPPYGSFNAATFKELHHLRLLMVLWSVDTGDYARPGVQTIVYRALSGAHPGAIILMHDAGGDRSQTIAALPAIVQGLRKRGLRPVTVPRLLLDDPPPRGQKIPTSLTGG